MHYEEIIQAIKERRERMRTTQETLAELSGVGLRTLQKIVDVLRVEICFM